MIAVRIATDPGSPDVPNEDLAVVRPDLVIVLDGATVRTDTGCNHGVAWYVDRLAGAFAESARNPDQPLTSALTSAISAVAQQHPECDLSHPGTPSAAVGVIRTTPKSLDWLVLGDITLIVDAASGLSVVSDERVSATARAERAEADRHPIGSDAKKASLLVMKRAELAARNRPGGYWIAAADPRAADHALTGSLPLATVWRVGLLTDGATRAVQFGLTTWENAIPTLNRSGPEGLIRKVRAAEASDPHGNRWPRNKRHDDATAAYIDLAPPAETPGVPPRNRDEERGMITDQHRL